MLLRATSSGAGEQGFALMAVGGLIVGAVIGFVTGLPAFFATIGLMVLLRRRFVAK